MYHVKHRELGYNKQKYISTRHSIIKEKNFVRQSREQWLIWMIPRWTMTYIHILMAWCVFMMTSSNGKQKSASPAFCAGNSPVTGEFPAQSPVTWSLDVSFDLHLDRQLRKQWRRWWFETLLRSLWRHSNDYGLVWKRCILFTFSRVHHKPLYTWNIPQCTFCNRNMHIFVNFCYKMVHCCLSDWCIVGFVQQVYDTAPVPEKRTFSIIGE